MNLESRKMELINWITLISNEEIINRIEKIKNKDNDWWSSVPEEVQAEIEASVKQAESGKYVDHSTQSDKYKKYL